MRALFLVFAGLLFSHLLTAQVTFPSWPENQEQDSLQTEEISIPILDNLDINQDPRLEKMLRWHVENNKKRDGMEGFRVEIFFSSALNAKDQALNKKKNFCRNTPNTMCMLNSPHPTSGFVWVISEQKMRR